MRRALNPADPLHTNAWPAHLDRVVDGDTGWLMVDLGFDSWRHLEYRMDGIDCWPAGTPKGDAATQFVIDALVGNDLIIQCRLNRAGDPTDEKWGRWLVTLYVGSNAQSVNTKLLTEGLALPYDGHGPRPTSQTR